MAKPGTYSKDGETVEALDASDANRLSWEGWHYVEPKAVPKAETK